MGQKREEGCHMHSILSGSSRPTLKIKIHRFPTLKVMNCDALNNKCTLFTCF